MTILNALGETFSGQFSSCGHNPIDSESAGREILARLRSGESSSVQSGMHSLSGHATPAICATAPDQLRALGDVARGVMRGDFAVSTHGALLAGSQFQASRIAREAGQPVEAQLIHSVYEAVVRSPRATQEKQFRDWTVGTSLAALRECRDPREGKSLIQGILGDPALRQDLFVKTPSTLREMVILGAPSLCMPELFEVYELAVRYGSPREKGLGVHNAAQLPSVMKQLGRDHPAIPTLTSWATRYVAALDEMLDQKKVEATHPTDQSKSLSERDIQRIREALRS